MKAMALNVSIQVPQDRIAATFYHTTIQQSRKRGEERVLRKACTEHFLSGSGPISLLSLMLAIEIFSKALTLKFRDTFPFISFHLFRQLHPVLIRFSGLQSSNRLDWG